jgi:prepilin-type N-terminal cleavage/methylation domain-containing protein
MRFAPSNPRAGVTLVEMLVVILIIGLTAGVSAFSISALHPPIEADQSRRLRQARAEAIRRGVAVLIITDSIGGDRGRSAVRFEPDGRVIGVGIDPWTGAPLPDNAAAGR